MQEDKETTWNWKKRQETVNNNNNNKKTKENGGCNQNKAINTAFRHLCGE